MSYNEYADTGTKCALCGKTTFGETIPIAEDEVCSDWCKTEYERRQ